MSGRVGEVHFLTHFYENTLRPCAYMRRRRLWLIGLPNSSGDAVAEAIIWIARPAKCRHLASWIWRERRWRCGDCLGVRNARPCGLPTRSRDRLKGCRGSKQQLLERWLVTIRLVLADRQEELTGSVVHGHSPVWRHIQAGRHCQTSPSEFQSRRRSLLSHSSRARNLGCDPCPPHNERGGPDGPVLIMTLWRYDRPTLTLSRGQPGRRRFPRGSPHAGSCKGIYAMLTWESEPGEGRRDCCEASTGGLCPSHSLVPDCVRLTSPRP